MSNEALSSALNAIVDELLLLTKDIEESDNYYPRGTILKALPEQGRFKPKSMWVSLGNGKYKHLNGKKGLVTKHDRLDGYTSVIFSA